MALTLASGAGEIPELPAPPANLALRFGEQPVLMAMLLPRFGLGVRFCLHQPSDRLFWRRVAAALTELRSP